MATPYTKTAWVDNTTPAINAANLNNIENGVNSALVFFNPKSTAYGAAGDGVTNDTTALLNCVTDACNAGGIMVVPPGTYLVSSLQIPTGKSLKIMGLGLNSQVVLKHASTTSDLPIIYANDAGTAYPSVWVENLTFLGQGQGLSGGNNKRGAIWVLSGVDVVIRDCIITDFADYGINIYPSGGGRVYVCHNRVQRCTSSTVQSNAINLQTSTPFFTFTGDAWCCDNYVTDMGTGGGGIYTSFVTSVADQESRAYICRNTVKNPNSTAAAIAVESDSSRYTIIEGNQCYKGQLALATGGNAFSNQPQISRVIIANNLIDMQLLTGSIALNIIGSNIIAKGNYIRHASGGIGVFPAQTGPFAERVIVESNILEYLNGSSLVTDIALRLTTAKNCVVRGNTVGRVFARVIGTQTVGAGATLLVDDLAGWPTSGSILHNGTSLAYTAITQATTLANAKITLTAGGSFTDGDLVYVGGAGNGLNVDGNRDCTIENNRIVGAGTTALFLSGNTRLFVRNNDVVNSGSQSTGGQAIWADGTNTDLILSGNSVIDNTASVSAAIGILASTGETRFAIRDNYVGAGIATPYFASTPANVLIDRNNRKSTTAPNGGTSTQTPGAVTTVTIAHGLTTTPTTVSVQPANANARGAPAFHVTVDGTNITLNFAAALTAATSYSWIWSAIV